MKENNYQTTFFSNNLKSLSISRPFLRGFCISSFTLVLCIWTSSHRSTDFTVPKQNVLSFRPNQPLLLYSLPQLQHHSHPIAQARNCVISLSLLLLFFSLIWVICEPSHIKLLFKCLISFSSTLSILIHFTPHRDYQNSMTQCMFSVYIVLYIYKMCIL